MAMQSVSNESVLPLPLRTPPSPDEDLLSVLRRCASRMGYPDVRWLLRPTEGNWSLEETDVPLLSAKRHYRVLGRLLQLSQEELFSHTLHRFAPLLENGESLQQYPEQDSASTLLPQLSLRSREAHFLPIRSIRVCPVCLREPNCYDRLCWRMQLIVYCPQHRVRLLEKCPSCGTPIAAGRPSSYSCPRCQQGDYRAVDAVPLSPDNPLYLGERLLLEALAIELPTDGTAIRSLAGSPLSTLSDASYLALLKTVSSGLEAIFSDRELFLLIHMLCALPPEELTQLQGLLLEKKTAVFLLFHWVFLEWPSHFFTFLEVWYSLSTPPYMGQEPVRVLLSSDSLFQTPNKPDVDVWLHQAYQQFRREFRPNPERIDHLRSKANRLARSAYFSKEGDNTEPKTTRRYERQIYISPRFQTPTPPFPWESLGSVLSRAAKKVSYPYPEQLFFRPLFTPGSLDEYSRGEPRLPGEASDRILAYFLQVPEEDVPQYASPSLIASLRLPHYSVFSRQFELTEQDLLLLSWLRPPWRQRTDSRVCLYCAADREGYERGYWNLRGVLCCPLHQVRLLERCPVCLRKIPAIRSQPNHCLFCSSELSLLPAKPIPSNSMAVASTSLLLRMLQIPLAETSSAFSCFEASPLLTLQPSAYFALLVAFTKEFDLYYSFSQQHLLQLCHLLGESTTSIEQEGVDPYAVDAEVLLFHTIFSQWPDRLYTFLDLLYQRVSLPDRSPSDLQYRWRWLLANKWSFIVPDWLINAFKEHERQHPQTKHIPLLDTGF